ncbi:MAG: hypothetical protein BWY95_00537 [Bacteroidetes bacterium ADurb.BinA104]|nr:MAG: hypothetical protein BWY95_00537 [Bacteroidetes bacterium ADurb.BinA104]
MKDKIIRIQADRLNKSLGLPENTFMPRELLEKVATADINEIVVVEGNPVQASVSANAYAKLLLSKIDASNQV